MIYMRNKKGVSAVVATALILLITVAAVTIVWAVVIPMIQGNLDKSGACLDAVNSVSIGSDKTCYNATSKGLNLQLSRAMSSSDDFKGIYLELEYSDGSADTKTLDLTALSNIDKGSTKIISVTATPTGTAVVNKIKVTPIIGDNHCDEAAVPANVPAC